VSAGTLQHKPNAFTMDELPSPRDWIDFTYSKRDTVEEGDAWGRDLLIPCPQCARPILVDEIVLKSPSTSDGYGDFSWSLRQLECKCDIETHLCTNRVSLYVRLLAVRKFGGGYPHLEHIDNWDALKPKKAKLNE